MKGLFRAIFAVFRFLARLLSILRSTLFNLLLLACILLIISSFFTTTKESVLRDRSALVLAISGNIVEEKRITDPINELLSESIGLKDIPRETLLQDVVDAIRAAAIDPRISCLVLNLENMGKAGIDQLQTIGNELNEFKKHGKKVIAAEDFFTQKKYYLASYADTIILNPMGGVDLHGFGVYSLYFKDALDKLRVHYHIFRVGQYKSAVEPLMGNAMSPEVRDQNQQWLSSLWQTFSADICKNRSLPAGAVDDYINTIPQKLAEADGDTAVLAKARGLVDELKTHGELRDYLIEMTATDAATDYRQISYRDYLKTLSSSEGGSKDKIGIIVAEGTILNGDQPAGAIGSDSLATLIREARTDSQVKAVVLRINSGGGSVFASEAIRQELLELKKSGKPYVVSMGTVAASGGYWIAAQADEIWAAPTTITGSIGIFGAIPTFEDSLDSLGIHHDGTGTSTLAAGLDLTQPLPPMLAKTIQLSVERGYRQFLSIVSEGRKLDPSAMDSIGQGRVFDGKKAQQLGLVDKLGSLQDAVGAAARIAGVTSYSTEYLRKPMSIKTKFLQQISGHIATMLNASFSPGKDTLARLYRLLSPIHQSLQLNDPQGIYAQCAIDYF
ncbi:MAG: signal peptide peptidase SppA [Desulfocapsaceae bacterium]|nr:signal peptide peptidase SppA [Desulfocapsaceae bacterium]